MHFAAIQKGLDAIDMASKSAQKAAEISSTAAKAFKSLEGELDTASVALRGALNRLLKD